MPFLFVVFYNDCSRYYSPFSYECKLAIWKKVGCIKEGTISPGKLSAGENETSDEMDLK